MTKDGAEPGKNPLAEVIEGGLPQLLLGPAGKAISRLLGAVVEVPASYLDGRTQRIKDRTSARSKVTEAIAQKAAQLAVEDQDVLDRGLNSLLDKAYRTQNNRDAIAEKVIEQLADDPAPSDSPGPSDDWLNMFEDYAARASSESLRDLFSRVLAGEVRKPGSFSLSTMQFISVLDAPIAALIERMSPHVWNGSTVLQDAVDGVLTYAELLELEEVGYLNMGSGMLSINPTTDSDGNQLFRSGVHVIHSIYDPNKKLSFRAYMLTRSGRELTRALGVEPQIAPTVGAIWAAKNTPQKVRSGYVRSESDGRLQIAYAMDHPKPND